VTRRIAMWSGPRNISTAMMRSFSSRPDCFVSDEPFYGAFLKESGADHPMRDEVIASMETDWFRIADAMAGDPPDGSPIWYQKQMTHHMVGPVTPDDLREVTHAFLIRDPRRMVASYSRKREEVSASDLGIGLLRQFFDRGIPMRRPRAVGLTPSRGPTQHCRVPRKAERRAQFR
jgi:hypothetical protein